MMSSECIRRSGRERRAPKSRHLDDNIDEPKKSQPKQKSKKKAITKTNNNPPLSLIAKTNLSMEEVSLVSDILNIGAVVSTDSNDVSPTSVTATANNNNFAQGAPSSSSHSTSINNRLNFGKKSSTSSSSASLSSVVIRQPTNVDILRGRGGGTNHHPGNKKFRDEARVFRQRYKDKATTRREKYELSLTLVKRARDYGGRFLERRKGDDKNWYLMSEGDVRKKASQVLREDKWE